jgi:hypothetical protein
MANKKRMSNMKPLDPIDNRVAALCHQMNRLPGISTFSSCGGHSKRTCVSQAPRHRFYIMFEVTGWQGLKSLEVLLLACNQMEPESFITAHVDCEVPGSLAFTIAGRAYPDRIAVALQFSRYKETT